MTKIRKVALEEHFMAPGFQRYSKSFIQHMDSAAAGQLNRRLDDIGELRLAEMDRCGIDLVVISQTGPSVQAEPSTSVAVESARANNTYLAQQIARHPKRFAGFATLAMQDVAAATAELTRAVHELGFKGALINGHTLGRYYDDPAFAPFWERVHALDVPIYLHPTDASVMPLAYADHPELHGAAWGWGVETASHALRLLFSGLFDRYPGLKIILGHMGEGLPFLRWRFDSRFAAYPHGIKLERAPSAYIGSNIVITTSGVCSPAALQCAIAEMGAEAVMFSVDYPYESSEVAADFVERTPLDERTRALVCHGNAERLLKLTPH